MAWARQKVFNNAGGANPAGVCEAAVCLWQKHIQTSVGQFNWGSSAGDYLPSTQQADNLYQEFELGTYAIRFLSYLGTQVFPSVAGNNKVGDIKAAEDFGVNFSHYSGTQVIATAAFWEDFINDRMVRGDAVFLNLTRTGLAEGHAVGIYKGTDYIWVFDPNHGLYRGNANAGCCNAADTTLAAQQLAGLNYWDTVVYYGIHMRA